MTAQVDPHGAKLLSTPTNPAPDGANVGYFRTSDKVQLRYALFPRQGEIARGTVCLVQGRTEYIEKYFETIADFQKRGFAVATFDWRGQGGSDRLIGNKTLGYVDRFEDYWTDLRCFHRDILLPDCPGPFYLVGHSMGGMASLYAATQDRMIFDRVFLSAPMVGLHGMEDSLPKVRLFAEAVSFLGFGQLPMARRRDRRPDEAMFPHNPQTSDERRYKRMVETLRTHESLYIGSPTFRWLASAMGAMVSTKRDSFPGEIKIPVLMLAAGGDRIVSTPAIEELGLRLRTGHHMVVPGALHELFMENDRVRAQVFAAFDAFVTDQTV